MYIPNTIETNAIIKINNGGNWNLYKKTFTTPTSWTEEWYYRIKPELHDYSTFRFGFDMEGFDYELLHTEPQVETRNIIQAVKNDILIETLEVELNKLIFAMLRFVLKEQLFVDWLFKTSFISLKHNQER